MADLQSLFDQLAAPFPSEAIHWRVGRGGMALAYLNARDVMDRLDAVIGPWNWQRRYLPVAIGFCCEISIRNPETGEWISKSDGSDASDIEGTKGGHSEAFKRAAVSWGIGRYLYDLKRTPKLPEGTKYISDALLEQCRAAHDEFVVKLGWGGTDARTYGNAVRLVDAAIQAFVHQPSDAIQFRKDNDAVFKALPVAARRRVEETLDRVGAL